MFTGKCPLCNSSLETLKGRSEGLRGCNNVDGACGNYLISFIPLGGKPYVYPLYYEHIWCGGYGFTRYPESIPNAIWYVRKQFIENKVPYIGDDDEFTLPPNFDVYSLTKEKIKRLLILK